MSCKNCKYRPKTYEEYYMKDSCPDAFTDIAVNCKMFTDENLKEEKDSDDFIPLPPLMTQRFAILDCMCELCSVAGDLSILQNHEGEMSYELKKEMIELTEAMKKFNEDFCYEY